MEGLSLNNSMLDEEIENLFSDASTEETQDKTTEESQEETPEKDKETTEAIDTDSLFDQEPESVGSEKSQEGENTESEKNSGASPKNNFYSSIAKALKEDGVLPDLEDSVADSIKEPEDFAKAIEDQIQARFDERQKRIDSALNANVEPSLIKQFENNIQYLDELTEEQISEDTPEAENVRKNLILRDYLNRGYTKEQANEKLRKSLDRGDDIDDAKEALHGNREFFKREYQKLVDEAKAETAKEEQERKQQAANLKKSILEDSKVFGELSIDRATRQKIYDNISKPVYKDSETGELFTAVQKYEMDNKTDFLKNVGLIYTLTDGFKNLDGLIKGKVRKEVKKGLRELEHTLNNTSRTSDGNLKFVSGVDDTESFIGKWDLDV